MLQTARARGFIEAISRDKLLVESDAPFRGSKGDLRATLHRLAEILGCGVADVEAMTDGNARRILPDIGRMPSSGLETP
jgi:TatD DNase family protein